MDLSKRMRRAQSISMRPTLRVEMREQRIGSDIRSCDRQIARETRYQRPVA